MKKESRTLAAMIVFVLVTTAAFAAESSPRSAPAQEAFAAYKDRDFYRAADMFKPLAEKGSAEAQFYLGECYREGKGVDKDFDQALKWYGKAATQGYEDALLVLATGYKSGRDGFPKNTTEAAKWAHIAAKRGYQWAVVEMGLSYRDGAGVPRSDAEAVKWFALAAQEYPARGGSYLAQMYEEGRGVPKDPVQAYKWYTLCGGDWTYGTPRAHKKAARLKNSMTPGQVEDAEKQISDFREARAKKEAEVEENPQWSESYRRMRKEMRREQIKNERGDR